MKRITSFLLAIVLFAGLVLTGAPTAHAASALTVSDALIEIIKKEEGFAAKPYWDYGQYTVGYGTRCPDDMLEEYLENGISEKEAETLLRNYLTAFENEVNKKLLDKYNLSLAQHQFDALVTFTYNLGTGWLSDANSNLHRAIRNGATGSELIWALTLWCNAGGQIQPGLIRRRLCEANMYLNGDYSMNKPSNYCYVYYNANGGSVSYRIQGYDSNEGIAPAYTPSYSGHTFKGWYTQQTGGSKVTVLTMELSGTTLYARWGETDGEDETKPEQGVQVTVTASDVNLRKGPGTNYSIVGTAHKGDKMIITETASGSGYEWGKADDKWIALQFTDYEEVIKEQEKEEKTTEPTEPEPTTEPTETTTPTQTTEEPAVEATKTVSGSVAAAPGIPKAKITGTIKAEGGLAVRKGPGTGYEVVKYLDNGAKVTVTEQQKAGTTIWGKTADGWVSMKYVALDTDKTTNPEPTVPETTVPEPTEPSEKEVTGTVKVEDALSVRKGAGTSYAIVKYLYNGDKVTITEVKEVSGTKWGYIGSGWVCMDYVVLDKQTAEKTDDVRTVTADCLNVRETASTSAKIVGYYYQGAKVTILETKTAEGIQWGKTSKGWICMDYVK